MKSFRSPGVFASVTVLCVIAVGWLGREYYLLPETMTGDDLFQLMESREPELGKRIALPDELLEAGHRPKLLVLLGACGECTIRSAELARIDLSGFEAVAAVTTSSELDLGLLPQDSVRFRVVDDKALHQSLNAYWTPRLALVGPKGDLRAIQHRAEAMDTFLKRCRDES